MLVRVVSDIHLEAFYSQPMGRLVEWFIPADPRDADSLLVLAGDITSKTDQLQELIEAVLKRFPKVLFVPGNHEFYRHNLHQWVEWANQILVPLAPDRLFISPRGMQVSVIDGVRFIYGTLWGDGGPTPTDTVMVSRYLNDFRLILMNGPSGEEKRFTVFEMVAEHQRAKTALEQALETPFDGPTVVVTHHLPSRRLVSARFWPGDGSDGANGGFVGECDSLLARTEISPDLWLFGHTHDTIDTTLWDTRVVCNPAGYRGEWATEHNTFMQAVPGEAALTAVPCFVEVQR